MVDHPRVEALEQGDAGVERGLEIELAAHRPLGHRRDLGLEPGIIGELVDAFDADHRRIHVGDEQPLAAARARAGRPRRRRRAALRAPRARRPGVVDERRSQALPSSTQFDARAPPPSASSAAEISPRVSRSFAIRVAMNMAASQTPSGAYRGADRERQVGAGAGAGGARERRRDQRRQRPGLSRPAHRLGAAERRRTRRARRTASTAIATAPTPARRRTGRRTPRRRSPRRMQPAGCRSWPAAPASTSAP